MSDTEEKTETYVVVGGGCWGSGKTLKQAKQRFTYEGGRLSRGYGIMVFDKDTTFHGINDFGRYEFTGNHPEITEVMPRKVR